MATGAKRVSGVPAFDGTDWALSHMRAIACVLRFHGKVFQWDDLMGMSGEAFCYYYHPHGTFLSQYVHSWDMANAALEAYGVSGSWRCEASDDVEPALEAMATELSEGRPVIAPGIMPAPDGVHSRCNHWFVVTGLDRAARKVWLMGAGEGEVETALPQGDSPNPAAHPRWHGILRSFDGIEGHYGPAGADNPLLLVDKLHVPRTREELLVGALTRAVALSREESVTCRFGYGAGSYLAGQGAIRQLRDDVATAEGDGLEEYHRLNPPGDDPFGGLNDELEFLKLLSWRRASAARFLRNVTAKLPASVHKDLAAAADSFAMSAAAAMAAFGLRYGSEAEHARMARIIWDECFEDNPDWEAYWRRADEALASAATRASIAGHLDTVLACEQAAVEAVDRALAEMGGVGL